MKPPGDWWLLGSCRDEPPDMFFPHRGEPTEPAKAVCAGCPVIDDCRDYAMSRNYLLGIWGGLSEAERQARRRTRSRNGDARRVDA